jgi:hypothetical protein
MIIIREREREGERERERERGRGFKSCSRRQGRELRTRVWE